MFVCKNTQVCTTLRAFLSWKSFKTACLVVERRAAMVVVGVECFDVGVEERNLVKGLGFGLRRI